MSLVLKYFLFLIWLSYILTSSLLLFTRGFLLNRSVLPNKSLCIGEANDCEHLNRKELEIRDFESPTCLGQGFKVILVIIDALRYDFVDSGNITGESMIYHNKLKILNELVNLKQARLYSFIADPPTTTLQRINALTTGSLPTFIDISSNFASVEINEDNLIDQLVSRNKNIVFMGDDTWTSLYPGRFLRQFPFPSFNVWDLDTVDKNIQKHLVPEIKKTDWNMIIAHFLGVDHCGHRYGANHPEMERKLTEMDLVIRNVVNEMDNETVLFIIGDHGMTDNGDHGGDSEKEVTSAMFVYSLNKLIMSRFKDFKIIQQVDLVPTLSQIFGVAIPFSNLGCTVLDFKLGSNCPLLGIWYNVKQVTNYIDEYSKMKHQFTDSHLEDINSRFKSLKNQFYTDYKNINKFKHLTNDARDYIRFTREICREIWVEFDSVSMSRGLILFILIIFIFSIILDRLNCHEMTKVVEGKFVWIGIILVIVSAINSYILFIFGYIGNIELAIYFITCSISVLTFCSLLVSKWSCISDNFYQLRVHKDVTFVTVAFRMFIVFVVITVFSNSYVIEENSVVPFLLVAFLWMCIFDFDVTGDLRPPNVKIQSVKRKLIALTVALNFLIRLSFYYWRCREEQLKKCFIEKDISKSMLCVLTILSFIIFITVVRIFLRNVGNLVGFSVPVSISRCLPILNVVCCSSYWVLNSLPSKTKPRLFLPWQLILLPRIVFFTSIASLIGLYLSPLLVYCNPRKLRISHQENKIPALFNTLKNIMTTEEEDNPPIVYGLATVYSATFTNIAMFVGLLSGIILGESHAAVVVIMVLSLTILSTIIGVFQAASWKTKDDLLNVPWWALLCWSLSCSHFFYATGHQMSFLTIQWNVAGLFGDIESTLIPGILVTLNTFISQIVHALLLPMLIIIPHTLKVVWPELIPITMQDSIFSQGEMTIADNNEIRLQGIFKLISKYLLLNALRVFMCMFSASIHSRHLMVWKIFAPKLIFESAGFLISIPFLFIGFLFMERISSKIDQFITKLTHSE